MDPKQIPNEKQAANKDDQHSELDQTKEQPNIDFENRVSLSERDRIDPADFDLKDKLKSEKFLYYYKTIESATGNPFFAKVLRKNKIKDRDNEKSYEQHLENFKNELNIISKLKHPVIIKYIGFSPNGFSQKHEPSILTEFAFNGSLPQVVEKIKLNDTQKLIIIYGIAVGMKYLHGYNIIHRNLTPSNILEDENLYPIISNFGFAYVLPKGETVCIQQGYVIGEPPYIAPEIYSKHEYSKKTDVYSFGMLVYYLLTNEIPFSDKPTMGISNEVSQGNRPQFNTPIPPRYQKLIESCWNQDPNQRPTFEEIIEELEEDPEFMINVIKELFSKYKLYIGEEDKSEGKLQQESTDEKRKIPIRLILKKFKFKRPKAMKNLIIQQLISQGDFYESYTVQVKNKSDIKLVKVFYVLYESYPMEAQRKISEIIKKILNSKHPSIARSIAFSKHGFGHEIRPTILTEYNSKIKLIDVIEKNVNNEVLQKWTPTKKLINIISIAMGMQYLHSRNILHGDLRPMNIYENDNLEPEINDFGLTGTFNNLKTIAKIKSISPFHAPEFYIRNEYSKKSEVYSYGLIVYSIITDSIPYKSDDVYENVYRINKAKKLPFSPDIPQFYIEFIERCLSENPDNRQSFEEIVEQLKESSKLLAKLIDQQEYLNFINSQENKIKLARKNKKKKDDDDEEEEEEEEESNEEEEEEEEEAKEDEITSRKNEGSKIPKKVDGVDDNNNKIIAGKDEGGKIPKKVDDDDDDDDGENIAGKENAKEENQKIAQTSNSDKYAVSLEIFIDGAQKIDLSLYNIDKYIKEGAYGVIYKAIEKSSGSMLAAKIFKMTTLEQTFNQPLNKDLAFTLKCIKREITFHSHLSKEMEQLVVEFLGYSPSDFNQMPQPLMLMNYLPNDSVGNLIENLRKGQPVPSWNDTKRLIIIYGIAVCMSKLHSQNILHRDLRPDNVLLDDLLYPKLTDFGLAINIANELDPLDKNCVGSDEYIAPEIWNDCTYTKASDVYAFGIFLYELITLKEPFEDLEKAQIVFQICFKKIYPVIPQSVPDCYCTLIKRCWDFDMEKRPSFGEIVNALKNDKRFTESNVNTNEYTEYMKSVDGIFTQESK